MTTQIHNLETTNFGVKKEFEATREKLKTTQERLKDHEIAYEQILKTNANMKLLAAKRRITTITTTKQNNNRNKMNVNENDDNDEENDDDVSTTTWKKREKLKRLKLKSNYSKLKTYLKEKRKKLKELERKDRLIVKMRKDSEEKEKEVSELISGLNKSLDLEKQKYAKIVKINSILETELKTRSN